MKCRRFVLVPALALLLAAAHAAGAAFGRKQGVPRSLRPDVGIVAVADEVFVRMWPLMYASQRAYAAAHGYEYRVLDPAKDAPGCEAAWGDFFFRKHCTVRHFLAKQPVGYTLLVLDGDVVAASTTASLDTWLDDPADVMLYERSWNFEIMAGNYLVRNTDFGRHFLDAWYSTYFWARTVRGFNSADNGAIHLVLLHVLASALPDPDFSACTRRYLALDAPSSNLQPYFAFVGCTRRAIGPARRWRVAMPVPGRLTVLNRYHGFALDGHMFGPRPNHRVPFQHGAKDMAQVDAAYGYEFRADRAGSGASGGASTGPWRRGDEVWTLCAAEACQMRLRKRAWDTGELGGHLARGDRHQVRTSGQGLSPWALTVPRLFLGNCVGTFSCEPAAMESSAPPPRLFHGTAVLFACHEVAYKAAAAAAAAAALGSALLAHSCGRIRDGQIGNWNPAVHGVEVRGGWAEHDAVENPVALWHDSEVCAVEGGLCRCPGENYVQYGRPGGWSSPQLMRKIIEHICSAGAACEDNHNTVRCGNGVFGDPAQGGEAKKCYCLHNYKPFSTH